MSRCICYFVDIYIVDRNHVDSISFEDKRHDIYVIFVNYVIDKSLTGIVVYMYRKVPIVNIYGTM